MISAESLAELQQVCPAAASASEAGQEFIDLPCLTSRSGPISTVRDALLTLQEHSGYASRALSFEPSPTRAETGTASLCSAAARHSPSWNGVAPGRPLEMLLQHLKVYQSVLFHARWDLLRRVQEDLNRPGPLPPRASACCLPRGPAR